MRYIIVAITGIGLLMTSGRAQDLPLDEMGKGFQAYNTYHSSGFDAVNLSNGTLTIRISLLSYPQLGSLPPVEVFIGASSGTQTTVDLGHCNPSSGPITNVWSRPPVPRISPSWVFRDFAWAVYSDALSCPRPVTVAYYQAIDANESHLLLGGLVGSPTSNGLSVILTATDGAVQVNDSAQTLTDRKGNVFTIGGVVPSSPFPIPAGCVVPPNPGATRQNVMCNTVTRAQDVHGNQITHSGGTWTDSLGRQIPDIPSGPNTTLFPVANDCFTLQYPAQAGGTVPLTYCVSNGQLQNVTLPNGASWGFTNWGFTGNPTPISITTPTGATVSYTFTSLTACGTTRLVTITNTAVATKTIDPHDGTAPKVWHYAYNAPAANVTTVTDPAGNDTVHTFSPIGGSACSLFETKTQYFQGAASGGTLLKTVDTTYYTAGINQIAYGPTQQYGVFTKTRTTTWPQGQVSQESFVYDSSGEGAFGSPLGATAPGYPIFYGEVVQHSETDYGSGGPGSVLRQTLLQYQWQGNGNYQAANLLDLPCVVTVYGPGSVPQTTGCTPPAVQANQLAQTIAAYDENNGSPQGVLGNPTSATHWLNGGTSPKTQVVYNSQGMPTQKIDANGNITTITYDSTGLFPSQVQGPDTAGVHHIDKYSYDANTGELMSHTDQNGQVTSYGYDNMRRLTSVTYPLGGGSETYQYNDTTPSPSFTLTKAITSSLNFVETGTADGLGRPVTTQTTVPASTRSSGIVTVTTTYDDLGRKATVSNPYCTTSDPTYGVTTYQYDALSRVTKLIPPDGTASTNNVSTDYSQFPTVTVTDEAGKQRRSRTDAVGRLVEVDEPSSSGLANPWTTLYTYDGLGNLTCVEQHGDAATGTGCSASASSDASSPWRVRRFSYDSLSRLVSYSNPESNTATILVNNVPTPVRVPTTYAYDSNGNLMQKTSPAPNQTGSTTQAISYCYDALNRVTGKAYSAQTCPLTSPVVTWAYDSGANGIGHLSSLTDQAGSGSYSFDVMGRVAGESRTLAGITKSMSYLYNLDGSIQSLTYPSGAVITYTPDSAGRMLSAVDNGNHINYVTGSGGPDPASGATYGPDGSILSFNQGWTTSFAGIANSFSYNPRLQPVNMAAVSPGTTGTNATASVTIGESLQSAPQPAATGSAMTTVTSGGVTTTHFLMPGGHLYGLYCSGNPMTCTGQDVTAAGGTITAAAGSPLVTVLNGSTPTAFFLSNGYIDDNWCTTSGCAWDNPFGDAASGPNGTPPAVATGSPLNAVATANGVIVYYLTSSGHVIALNTSHGFSDTWQDVTAAAGGNVTATAGSPLTTIMNGQTPTTFFLSNGYIDDNWCTTSGCAWDNPFGDAGQGPNGTPPAVATGSPLNAVATANGVIVYYLTSSGHVIALNTSHGFSDTWQDVTAAGGNITATAGSPMTTIMNGSTPTTFFLSNGNIIDNWCTTSGCSWDNPFGDAASGPNGAPPAVAAGSPLNALATANGVIVYYLSSNSHVIALNTSQGFSDTWQDLTALAAPDSGTVSLSVGRFTATACFGLSSGSACNGQPVNSSPNQVASALVAALNTSASPVTATVNGATINLTWKATGPFTTIVGALSTTHDNPSLFPNPSFTSAATNFSGGSGANVSVFSLNYDFHVDNGDNGNVFGIINNKDTTRNQTFTYDALNRLTAAQNAGTDCNVMVLQNKTKFWGNSYSYDAWGNLVNQGTLSAKSVTKCGAENLSVTADAQNRIHATSGADYRYDAAGNLTFNATPPVQTYTYDQENRITGAGGFTYTYDADGNRVKKSNGTTGTLYWYMSPGIVAESDLSGNLQSEYMFFDGERVARKDFPGNAVSYYFSDHLKTTDIVTDAQGNIKNESDFYPWGGELQFLNNDSNHYKFTGKERDSETGLDYFGARYYSNGLGRWVTPDWAPWSDPAPVPYADLRNPQSLNLYAYTKNNPTTLTDPNGHCTKDGKQHGSWWCFFHYSDQDLQRDADQARRNLKDVKNLIINGGTVQDFLKSATNQQVLAAQRAIGDFLLGDAEKHPCGYEIDGCAIVPFPPIGIGTGTAVDPDYVGLTKQVATEAQVAELESGGGRIIFGPGGTKPLQEANRLAAQYGGRPQDYVKIGSFNFKAADGVSFEVHAYKNLATGQIFEPKTKFQ